MRPKALPAGRDPDGWRQGPPSGRTPRCPGYRILFGYIRECSFCRPANLDQMVIYEHRCIILYVNSNTYAHRIRDPTAPRESRNRCYFQKPDPPSPRMILGVCARLEVELPAKAHREEVLEAVKSQRVTIVGRTSRRHLRV